MSPPPRRSARLASAVKPKAVPELSAVVEREETPPHDASQSADAQLHPERRVPRTPASSAIKPPHDEMHPSKARPTMGDPSSALRLGFSDIPSNKDSSQGSALTSTPSKMAPLRTSPFTFRFSLEAVDARPELSSDAQQIMSEIRDQAARIKVDLMAEREAETLPTTRSGRIIAKLKGPSGRYSAAHKAEFNKMDSIKGHASAWRAQNGRFTPLKSSLKRSPSKANLDGTPKLQASSLRSSPSKSQLVATPAERLERQLKRTSSVANLDNLSRGEDVGAGVISTPGKAVSLARSVPLSAAKRFKQRREDDSSSSRPVPDDASCPVPSVDPHSGEPSTVLPKSRSRLARLMSPTKSSSAHATTPRKPTASVALTPSKMGKMGIPKSLSTATTCSLPKTETAVLNRRIISAAHLCKTKSILGKPKITMTDVSRSAIPQPTEQASQTPASRRAGKSQPVLPLTTPRRRLIKHVNLTPEVTKAAVIWQESPSPQKATRMPLQEIDVGDEGFDEELDQGIAEKKPASSLYPDLSPLRRLMESRPQHDEVGAGFATGAFTFRSDSTIKFGDEVAEGFGLSPGQSSVRHVRGSTMAAADMPGGNSAPPSPSCLSNKGNLATSPTRLLPGKVHGMLNKKRRRASSYEDDAKKEEAERALKKRKNKHVPEGEALLAPRLIGKTPATDAKTRYGLVSKSAQKTPSRTTGRIPRSTSPMKKGAVLTMSRLGMLARPKYRG